MHHEPTESHQLPPTQQTGFREERRALRQRDYYTILQCQRLAGALRLSSARARHGTHTHTHIQGTETQSPQLVPASWAGIATGTGTD